MKKLYKSGNYIIIEDGNGGIFEFQTATTLYTLLADKYKIIDRGGEGVNTFYIEISDIVNWFKENGQTNYDENSLVEFLRDFTGFNSATGGSVAGFVAVEYSLNGGLTQVIGHNKSRFVIVVVKDIDGYEMDVNIEIIDNDNLRIRSNTPLYGTVEIY